MLLIISALICLSTTAHAPVYVDQSSHANQKYENYEFTLRKRYISERLPLLASEATKAYETIMASPFVSDLEVNKRLFVLADTLNSCPVDLIIVLYSESELSTTAWNETSDAYGLIQWMPKTRISQGITKEELKNMSILEQLDEVEKFYKDTGKVSKIKGFMDLYAAIFWPAAVGRGPDYRICKIGSDTYAKNSGVDMNKDGIITSKDLAEFGLSRLDI